MNRRRLTLISILVLLLFTGIITAQATVTENVCPHCNNTVADGEWKPWAFTDGKISSGHYYLEGAYSAQSATIQIPDGVDVCLDLNGGEYFTQNIQPFQINGTLTVIDTKENGQFITTGANNTNGGFAVVKSTGTLNIKSGTIHRIVRKDISICTGGLIQVDGGKVNISGGMLTGGVVKDNGSTNARGGNICLINGSLEISGGTITGGLALFSGATHAQGGNIFAGGTAAVTISGGSVQDGYSDEDGGNIYLSGISLTMTSGSINGGHAIRHGGNIAQANESAQLSTSLLGGTVTGGVAGGKLNASNANRGSGGGGNFYSYSAKGSLTVANCTVGGDMKIDAIGSVTLSGVTKIGLGKSNGLNLPEPVNNKPVVYLDVSGLIVGSEVFIDASGVFTTAIPAEDAERIAEYFKGAVRTGITLDTETYTLVGTQGDAGYCPHCYDPANPAKVTWYKIGFTPTSGKLHCYMAESHVGTGNRTVSQDIVLDLNGYTYYKEAGRVIMWTAGKSLSVLDTVGGGRLKGEGSDASQNANGAVIQFAQKANVTIYSGTLTMELKSGATSAVPKGGVINASASGSTLTLNGGIISGGIAVTEGGGNIHMNTGTTMTMNAGIVKGGTATNLSGGNLYCAGQADIYGGFIVGGAAANGGNAYVTGELNLVGGTIAVGDATAYGGNIYGSKPNANLKLSGGIVASGTANDAGNMYCDGSAEISGTLIVGGDARFGGSLFFGGGSLDMTKGTLIGGNATTKGGNIYSSSTGTKLNISGGVITSGTAPAGGNIHLNNGTLNFTKNALIMNGITTSTGGNIHIGAGEGLGSATANLSGGKITGGISRDGGNIYTVQITNLSGTTVTKGQATNGGNVGIGGGTLTMSAGTVSGGFVTERGGNFYQSGIKATLIQTGGTISDGQAVSVASYETSGGNICITNGALKITGGTVSNGFAHTGGNIHLGFYNNSTATIGGDNNPVITGGTAYGGCGGNISFMDMAHQDEEDDFIPRESEAWFALGKCTIQNGDACSFGENIYVYKNAHFRVLDSFEGTTSAFFHYDHLPDNSPYGAMLDTSCNTSSGDFTGKLILENYDDMPYAFYKDGNLQIASAALVKNGAYTWFRDNTYLAANYGDSDYMRPCAGELSLTAGTYTVDLAGQTVNITGSGATVYGMDSANDSYRTFGTASFGNGVTLAGIKTTVNEKTYFALQDSNSYTFHRAGLDITSVSLRPNAAGLYYSALWQCDDALAKEIDTFGVAVSLAGAPTDNFIARSDCLYTCQDGFVSGTTSNGVLVSGILNTNREELNSSYAQTPIYAAAYITIDDKSYTGAAESYSLHSLLKLLNDEKYTYYTHSKNLQNFMDQWDDFGLTGNDWDLNFKVPAEIAMLGEVYSGTNAYQGELHDHADTGGKSDGKNTLAQWVDGMKKLDMDFATILDHRQDRHMHLDDWDETQFIGGTEIGIGITDLANATRSWLHSNMIFADWRDLRAAFEEFDNIAPGGGFRHEVGDDGAWYMTNLEKYSDGDCRLTKAQMAQLIEIIRKNNGMFVHPHAKLTDCVVSENSEDYWFADWTGLEVMYTYKNHPSINPDYITANYKLWVDLLASGKKIWATAGNDEHAMANNKALTTVYATEKHAVAFMEQIANGNFTAGPVGIQMAIGDSNSATAMGGECDFTEKDLVFSVGNYHSSIASDISNYKILLFADENVIDQWQVKDGNNIYHYQEADPSVHYYRVEIRNAENDALVALGNPIWNTAE